MTVDNGNAPVIENAPIGTPEPAAAPTTEPKNVREAIEQRRAAGVPAIIDVPDEPAAAAPVIDDEASVLADLTAPPAGVTPPAAPAGTPDPFAEFGGADAVRDAVTLANGMRSEQGLRAVIANGLHALGYDPSQVRAALEARGATPAQAAAAAPEPAAAPDPYASVADDDVVTGAELKAIVQAAIAQTAAQVQEALVAQTKPLEDQFHAERQRTSQAVVDGTLVELLGAPPADPAEAATYRTMVDGILAEAARGFDQSSWDPSYIRSQIIRGHGAFTAAQEQQLRAYAARKAAARAAVPAHVGGGSAPGGEDVPEPKSVKEAIAMRKAQGIF